MNPIIRPGVFDDEELDDIQYSLTLGMGLWELEELDETGSYDIGVCKTIPGSWDSFWRTPNTKEYEVVLHKEDILNWNEYYPFRRTLALLEGDYDSA